jgi:chromosome partitioning protein, DNA-binding protein
MPKLEPAGVTQKISLSQIIETGNVRKEYQDIEELAQSIKDSGLMQPIVVKRAGVTDTGIQQYELIAGHRRKRAFEYLCSKGDDFNMIDAVVKTGDTLTLQLIENIQRNDLTAAEREQGVAEMLATGISQQEISSKLAKTEQWVSKHLAAHRVRVLLQQQNIDTEQYETTTLNVFRTIPESDLKPLIEKTAALGGTRAAAESVIRTYKNIITQPAQSDPATHSNTDRSAEPAMITPLVTLTTAGTAEKKHTPTTSLSNIPVSAAREKNEPAQSFSQAAPKQINSHSEKKSNDAAANEEKIPVADKLISSKFVFAEITAYIKAIENTIKTLDSDSAKLLEQAKIEAAYDIIALLHTDTKA